MTVKTADFGKRDLGILEDSTLDNATSSVNETENHLIDQDEDRDETEESPDVLPEDECYPDYNEDDKTIGTPL